MATFTFGRTVDIHWNGFEVVGPAGTVFSIPDQLYDEFNDDIFPVEPTLTWIDTNEFLTLSNSVSVSQLEGTFPISVTTTTSGKNVSISSSTNPAGYTIVADGTGGVIFQAASTGALTSVVGISPISSIIVGNTASVSVVAGSINSTHLSATSVGSSQLIAGSVGSAALAANSVVAAKIDAGAVGTAKLTSGAAAAATVLTADGAGNASFQATSGGVGLDSVFLLMGA